MDYLVLRRESPLRVDQPVATLTYTELLWVEVIRQASADSDPPLSLDRVRRVRALFREARV